MSETEKRFEYHEYFVKRADGSGEYDVTYAVRGINGKFGPRRDTLKEAYEAVYPPTPTDPTP